MIYRGKTVCNYCFGTFDKREMFYTYKGVSVREKYDFDLHHKCHNLLLKKFLQQKKLEESLKTKKVK